MSERTHDPVHGEAMIDRVDHAMGGATGRLARAALLVSKGLQRYLDAGGVHQGAAVAFYAAFSIAPLLVVVAAVMVWMLGSEVAQSTLLDTVSRLIGDREAHVVSNILAHRSLGPIDAVPSGAAAFGSWIALGTTLLGATGVFTELRRALQAMLGESDSAGWRRVVRMRLLGIALVLACGVLLPMATLAQAGGLLAMHRASQRWPELSTLFGAAEEAWSWAVIAVLFALIIRWLPNARIKLRHALAGAGIAAGLFMLGRFGITLYIATTANHATLGAAGAFAALLVWVYWSSQIFLIGAAIAIELGRPGTLHHRARLATPAGAHSTPAST